MDSTNISKYVAIGSILAPNKKELRKHSMAPVLLTILCGIVPGVILKSYWLSLTIALSVIAVSSALSVFIISSKSLTLKRRLIIDSIIFGAWVSEISILEFMYFTIWKGFHIGILLLYIPVVLVPLLIGIKIHKLLMGSEYDPKKVAQSSVRTVGWHTGILGMNFAAIFRNIDQNVAFIVVLIGLSLLNGMMSLGLLSIQKLYYLKKYDVSEQEN